ncbi:hypothetical protein LTR66_013106 [Elasticomyces elasticus]|nr:hypothetical protein LTR66_013106 [Elasticomyces elasticus]
MSWATPPTPPAPPPPPPAFAPAPLHSPSAASPAPSPHAHSPSTSSPAGQPAAKKRRTNSVDDSLASLSPKHPGVKRACNECRQQKLRCDVITEPTYVACKRCQKFNVHCSIDTEFKRTGKRAQNEAMAKELAALRAENAELRAAIPRGIGLPPATLPPTTSSYTRTATTHLAPHEAAATRSLIELSQGYDPGFTPENRPPTRNTLGRVFIPDEEILELYTNYFTSYHPFLPLLPTDEPWDSYFDLSPLLHWTILSVSARTWRRNLDTPNHSSLSHDLLLPLHKLLWDTIADNPQSFHFVKALCLLCTWPMPTSSTSQDPTMTLCGVLMQNAFQFGLHRPNHAQDFSRFKVELREDDISDRVNTWAACNVVAQSVSTGYGQPCATHWNWFLYGRNLHRLAEPFRLRCAIEKFCDKVTRTLYSTQRDTQMTPDEVQRAYTIDLLAREYSDIVEDVHTTATATAIDYLHLYAAGLHLRLSAFFDPPTAPQYRADLSNLYIATTTFLSAALSLDSATQPTRSAYSHVQSPVQQMQMRLPHNLSYVLANGSNYIMQTIVAAGFTLLKLLNSFFAKNVDVVQGRTLFAQTITAVRAMSVARNDLPQRLAEVLAQLWQASGASQQRMFDTNNTLDPTMRPGSAVDDNNVVDGSLQLKVRCRGSRSLVFDSVWRWREEFGRTRELDKAVERPTELDTSGDAKHAVLGSVAQGGYDGIDGGGGVAASGMDGLGMGMGDDASFTASMGYDVFDPLSWLLDGHVELPMTEPFQ